MTTRPILLLIDDDPAQEAFALLLSDLGVDARHVLPDDLTQQQIHEANVIIVDEFLEDWRGRDAVADVPGLNVRDGVALAGVLRAELERRGPTDADIPQASQTAIILRTGHLDRLAWGLPRAIWSIAVAGRYDLEWVLTKAGAGAEEVAAIAHAALALPRHWEPSVPTAQLDWLALEESDWSDDAIAQVEECRPPWSTLAATSSGRVWLAWFLQRILPFSTFLIDDARAAGYLGLSARGLDLLLEGPVGEDLAPLQYRGELAELKGRRWWRAGVQNFRRKLLARTSFEAGEAVESAHGAELPKLDLANPVFLIDRDYEVALEPVEAVDAVRLQPDEWPSYADDPWALVQDLTDEPELKKLVVLDDRDVDV